MVLAHSAWQVKQMGTAYMSHLIRVRPKYRGWTIIRFYAMIAVVVRKFRNPRLGAKLKKTGTKLLLEANPRDLFWGTGRGRNALIKDQNFKGHNWCGEAIMTVRRLMFGPEPSELASYQFSTSKDDSYSCDDANPSLIKFYSPKSSLFYKLRAANVLVHPWISEIKLIFCTSDFTTSKDLRPQKLSVTKGDKEAQQAFLLELQFLSETNPDTRIAIVRQPLTLTTSLGDKARLQLTAEKWDKVFESMKSELLLSTNVNWEGKFQQNQDGYSGQGDSQSGQVCEEQPRGTLTTNVDMTEIDSEGQAVHSGTESSVTPPPDDSDPPGEKG